MDKLKNYLKLYTDELLYKVQWPTFEELQSSTLAVLVASLLVAIVIALYDTVFNTGLRFIYNLF
ncbi:MAG: preprotein translocase subunit SecE [Bacteroidia bacterium]|nr:preprotein translocase subunit SecE [Bacteroidia bacterium]